MTDIQTLNYCTHAIEDLHQTSAEVAPMMAPLARCYDRIAECLQGAVKFILPNKGELLDLDHLSQAHYDLLRLPFPCIALEAPWLGDHDGVNERLGQKVIRTTKRIALCWDPAEYLGPVADAEGLSASWPEGGVCVLPLFMTAEHPRWQVAHGLSFLPFGSGLAPNSLPDTEASRLAYDTAQREGNVSRRRTGGTMVVRVLTDELIPTLIQAYGSLAAIDASIMAENRDEAQMLIQACAVLNCANVETFEVAAPEKLNKARLAKGRVPFFSYKVLTLSMHDTQGRRRTDSSGTHDAPRQHLRRGHLRRLPGKTIWVRPTMVGHHGEVSKTYRIKP